MQIFSSINYGDIIFTNQILKRSDPLLVKLVDSDAVTSKNFSTQWRSPPERAPDKKHQLLSSDGDQCKTGNREPYHQKHDPQ